MKKKIEIWCPDTEYHIGDRFRISNDPRVVIVVPADCEYGPSCFGVVAGKRKCCVMEPGGCKDARCYGALRASKDDVCFVYESDPMDMLMTDLKAAKGVIKSACKQHRLDSPQGCDYLKSWADGCASCRIGNLVRRIEKHLEEFDA